MGAVSFTSSSRYGGFGSLLSLSPTGFFSEESQWARKS